MARAAIGSKSPGGAERDGRATWSGATRRRRSAAGELQRFGAGRRSPWAKWLALVVLIAGCRPPPPPPVTPRAAPAPPPPAPAPPRVVPLEEDPVPDGPTCARSEDCADDAQCRGPAGCGQSWACGAPRECGDTRVAYCGCDAATFYAPENCPGEPYVHVGPCAALGEALTEAPEPVEGSQVCTSNADCRRGYVCTGAVGCGTLWTCQRPWRLRPRCRFSRGEWCSCAGETFSSRSSCPGRPVLHPGACGPGDAALAAAMVSRREPGAATETADEGPAAAPDDPLAMAGVTGTAPPRAPARPRRGLALDPPVEASAEDVTSATDAAPAPRPAGPRGLAAELGSP